MLEDNAVTSLADTLGWLLYHVLTFFNNIAPGYLIFMIVISVGIILITVLYSIRKEVMKSA